MPFIDPTPHRVSACPVHFIWDGRGRGRPFVRAGFLAMLFAFGASMLQQITHVDVLTTIAVVIGGAGLVSWCAGHALARIR